MSTANFDGSGVKACPIAGPSQSWESFEEDLEAWKLSTELREEHVGPHIKSRGFSNNTLFKNQAKLLDHARLSGKPSAESSSSGTLGYNYLLEFMRSENRSKDDVKAHEIRLLDEVHP